MESICKPPSESANTPVVIGLASNDCYFHGLYCAVASALCQLDPTRKVEVRVLDGGISESSRDKLSRFVDRFRRSVQLEFVPIDDSVFRGAALGPGNSHMTYCRILLPQLIDAPRLIYLDCDVLVFRDLSELFDLKLAADKILAAVPDSETLTLGDDSSTVANAMKLPVDGVYFNSGVMLMNLDELRRQRFREHAMVFVNKWSGRYRFWDQSAINFLLHQRIESLPEHWNRASWRFNEQESNHLDCLLHYTTSAPWLGGTCGPAQVLFERFAGEAGLPVNRQSVDFKKSAHQSFWRNALAPLRVIAFPIASLLYRIAGRMDKSAAYKEVARYWFDYIRNAPRRRELHRRRIEEIVKMKFDVRAAPLAS
jgi:lipopolysaccharide biosynthesis glycosyltransferase